MKLTCPKCGTELPASDVNLALGLCTCARCGEHFKIAVLITDEPVAVRTERPAYSRLEFTADRESLGLIVPPGGDKWVARFFLFFSLIWNLISWPIFLGALFKGQIFLLLFLTLFVAIGLLFAVFALYAYRGEFTLSIDRQRVHAIWTLFRYNFERSAANADVTAVVEEVVYTRNYQPVYGIAIKHGTRTIKFGSSLTEDERRWLIGEIRHFLAQAGATKLATPGLRAVATS
jgi:hypothetical protein